MSEQLTLDPQNLKELREKFDRGINASYALASFVEAYWETEKAKRKMADALDAYARATGKELEGDPIPKLKANIPKLGEIVAEVRKRFPGVSTTEDPFEWDASEMQDILSKFTVQLRGLGIHV